MDTADAEWDELQGWADDRQTWKKFVKEMKKAARATSRRKSKFADTYTANLFTNKRKAIDATRTMKTRSMTAATTETAAKATFASYTTSDTSQTESDHDGH